MVRLYQSVDYTEKYPPPKVLSLFPLSLSLFDFFVVEKIFNLTFFQFDYVLPFLSSQPLHEDEVLFFLLFFSVLYLALFFLSLSPFFSNYFYQCYIKSQIIEPKDPEEGTGALLQYLSQERSLVKEMIKEERENEKEREKEREEMWQGMKEEIEQLKVRFLFCFF